LCAQLPRVSLCSVLPTPMEEAPRLSRAAGGSRILLKREDLTGLALGGNKIRSLEFVFGDLRAQGCNAVITTAGVQSNMCRATAAAASRLGLRCVLLLRGTGNEARQGNLLLDDLLGADVRFIPTRDPYDGRVPGWLDEVKRELVSQGHRPYVLHLTGGTSAQATCAYVDAAEELVEQLARLEVEPDWLYVTVGSGITAAGLALGIKHLRLRTRVVGVSASSGADFLSERIVNYATGAAETLGLSTRVSSEDFDVLDAYVGPGYGEPYPEAVAAIRLVAREEGVLLDPVYTGKCMAALLGQIQSQAVGPSDTVVFVHSGGAPNLFAGAEDLAGPIGARA